MRRWLPWLALALVLAVTLAVGTRSGDGPRSNAERADALASELRCPTCRGQSVRDSDAPTAAAIRTEIAQRVDEGQSDGQIKAYLVDRFTESILLNPPRSGVGSLVWVLPVAALVAALAGLTLAFRRWRGDPSPALSEEDRTRVRQALRSQP